jgi:hypothetical protein
MGRALGNTSRCPLIFIPPAQQNEVAHVVDAPRREPTDIIFVNPEDGTPATFMARNASP